MNERFTFDNALDLCFYKQIHWEKENASTWAKTVRSLRRNGKPSSSSRTSSVVIKRLSLICVQIFANNSFDWNKGGRFEADDARLSVRRSATKKFEKKNTRTFNNYFTIGKIIRWGIIILAA